MAGRPQKEISQEIFEELCGIMATQEEIASFFHCSEETIRRWCNRVYGMRFCEVFKKLSVGGKMSIRRAQMNLAKTNASMAIWLGKQYLGQREPEQTFAVEHITPIIDDI